MNAPHNPPPAATPPQAAGGAHTWTITLPSGMRLITLNDRLHHMVKYRYARALRETACVLARQQRIPHLGRIRIDGELIPADRRRRDAHNWMDTAKPCVDGLVDAGVITDDSTPYLDGPFLRIADVPSRPQRFVLHITELPTLEVA